MSDCPLRHLILYRGCKFEPRYDKRLPDRLTNVKADAENVRYLADMMEAAKETVYVCDVCTLCGKTLERNDAAR